MINNKATAIAHPNIALIKYWGNRDHELRIPENGSISFNLGGLSTKTTVEFDQSFEADSLEINGIAIENSGLKRVSNFLELIRKMAEKSQFARVTSENNFPIGAGVASSAAGFAALSLSSHKSIWIRSFRIRLVPSCQTRFRFRMPFYPTGVRGMGTR